MCKMIILSPTINGNTTKKISAKKELKLKISSPSAGKRHSAKSSFAERPWRPLGKDISPSAPDPALGKEVYYTILKSVSASSPPPPPSPSPRRHRAPPPPRPPSPPPPPAPSLCAATPALTAAPCSLPAAAHALPRAPLASSAARSAGRVRCAPSPTA